MFEYGTNDLRFLFTHIDEFFATWFDISFAHGLKTVLAHTEHHRGYPRPMYGSAAHYTGFHIAIQGKPFQADEIMFSAKRADQGKFGVSGGVGKLNAFIDGGSDHLAILYQHGTEGVESLSSGL